MKVQVGVTARRDPETGEFINTEKIVRKIRKDSKFASELCLPYGAAAILCAEFLKYTELNEERSALCSASKEGYSPERCVSRKCITYRTGQT